MRLLRELDADDTDYVAYLRTESEKLLTILNRECFEGDRFVRGFTEAGEVIGSAQNREAALWLNPQSWAVISGAATGSQADAILSTAHARDTRGTRRERGGYSPDGRAPFLSRERTNAGLYAAWAQRCGGHPEIVRVKAQGWRKNEVLPPHFYISCA